MDQGQQAAAIVLQLGGAARDLMRNISLEELTRGGTFNGQPADPVSNILQHLATHFAPLGEETRMSAMTELMSFNRKAGESIDTLLSRFLTVRHRTQMGGTGMAMSWEGFSYLLLRACGPDSHQLLNILQPFQGRWPSTEAEFNAMQLTLRRMGHILEGHPGNIASRLRSGPSRTMFTGVEWTGSTDDVATTTEQQDPWTTGADPWQAGWSGTPATAPITSETPTYHANPEEESGTDTDTASDTGEVDYDDPDIQGLTGSALDEQIFWEYQRHIPLETTHAQTHASSSPISQEIRQGTQG